MPPLSTPVIVGLVFAALTTLATAACAGHAIGYMRGYVAGCEETGKRYRGMIDETVRRVFDTPVAPSLGEKMARADRIDFR